MGTIKNFEDLVIWQMAREIVKLLYSDFRSCKDFGFRDQISRAGVSVGSIGEVKNMYYIAEDLNYITNEEALKRRDKSQQLINSISKFIQYLKSSK